VIRTLALLALPGCAPSLAVGVPWLEIPDSVSVHVKFGVVNVVPVDVTNDGTARAVITATAFEPLLVTADSVVAEPGQIASIPVLYQPDSYQTRTGTVVVETPVQSQTVSIVLFVTADADQDGYPALGAGGTDCDDDDPLVHPDAPEACDGVDQDCDGAVDDDPADPPSWYADADGDGYGDAGSTPTTGCSGPTGSVDNALDCDDGDAAVSPDAVEVWYDGVDQDCDGADDFDQDADGHRSDSFGGDDCDDRNAAIHAGAIEVWYDGLDQDCDGNDDDQDYDGVPGAPFDPDCDDLDPTVHPGAPELDDGLDQDCDGLIDEGVWVHGTLVVSEVLLDPAAVLDSDGRFLELYNPTDGDVELGSVTVGVGGNAATLSSVVLAPGGAWVVCANADVLVNGGVTCGNAITWPNGATTATVTGGGVTLDELDWGAWAAPSGASLELAWDALDPVLNDDLASWCAATTAYGSGDLGTPGVVATPCP
jgi:hypothetical protein